MNYKCLLVDDEPLALTILESYISMIPNLELVGKCSNAFEAIKAIQSSRVDIIFLDINMPQLSGVELLRSMRYPPRIIFTTAHKQYALDAFELEAVDYLLKPISLERFIKAVNKIDNLRSILPTPTIKTSPMSPFLYFRADRKMIKVLLDDIVYIESLKDYIKIFRNNKDPLVVKQSISSLEEMLPGTIFLRIHRSFIISMKQVISFSQDSVQLPSIEIPVGKIYKEGLKRLFNH